MDVLTNLFDWLSLVLQVMCLIGLVWFSESRLADWIVGLVCPSLGLLHHLHATKPDAWLEFEKFLFTAH